MQYCIPNSIFKQCCSWGSLSSPCCYSYLWLHVRDVIEETHTTVGSHLFELQLSKYIGYPNAFSKVTPATFVDEKLALVF